MLSPAAITNARLLSASAVASAQRTLRNAILATRNIARNKRRVIVTATGLATVVAAGSGIYLSPVDSPYAALANRKNLSTAHAFGASSQESENEELSLVYDVAALQSYWRARPLEVLGRSIEVVTVVGPYLAKLFIWEYLIRRKIRDHPGLQKKYAVKLRELLTTLGPCFVKFGQALSIRPDVLPSSFLDELQKLCDSVPSFPTSDAISVIEEELGPGVTQRVFEDFSVEVRPVAAASLGQVYKLKLKNGDWVALKVQRPDMKRFILRDLYIMRNIATIVEIIKCKLTSQRPYDVALLDTFAAASLNELDYLKEAENQETFRKDLVPKLNGQIYIPKVYHDLTTRRVLVTEWIEGEKLAQSSPEIINKLTPVGIECFLCQLLETGYFHADPHPGNLLVTKEGKLAVIDFGLCAAVPLPDTRTMTLAIVHLIQGDVGGLVEDAIELGFLPRDTDTKTLTRDLQGVFDSAQIAVQDELRNLGKFKAVASRRKKFWAVSRDLNKIFFDYPFLVPDYFALITRAMIVLEGIAVTGDPEFDIFASSYPYALRRAVSVFGMRNLSEIAKEAALARMNLPPVST